MPERDNRNPVLIVALQAYSQSAPMNKSMVMQDTPAQVLALCQSENRIRTSQLQLPTSAKLEVRTLPGRQTTSNRLTCVNGSTSPIAQTEMPQKPTPTTINLLSDSSKTVNLTIFVQE